MKKALMVIALATVLTTAVFSPPAAARLGVGINVGKIVVDEPLLSGGIYPITKMAVINTGDEAGSYELDVSYIEGQKELSPPKEWFSFKPKEFRLKPKQAREVEIGLVIPVQARAGDYFALVEAHPVVKKKAVTIGIAAAAKMSFSVNSSSLLWSIINRIVTWFTTNAPYSYIAAGVIAAAAVILLLRRFFRFSFRIERKGK